MDFRPPSWHEHESYGRTPQQARDRTYLGGPGNSFEGLANLDVLSPHTYRPGNRAPEGLLDE